MKEVVSNARSLFVGLIIAITGFGCAGGENLVVKSGVEGTARVNYYRAMVEMEAANYIEANTLFALVARSPSYVKYAALAQLRLADLLFLQGRYRAAIARYTAFVAQQRSNPNMPYARFRAAACYFRQLPTDLAILPPAYEGDQTMAIEARRELRRFIRDFPISRFSAKAESMLTVVERLLCDHELYVADFYAGKDKPQAVAWRLSAAIDTYPKCALTEENVWRLGEAYAKAGGQSDAIKAYTLYLEKFPSGARRTEIATKLQVLRKKSAPPAPTTHPPIRESPKENDDAGQENE